MKKPKYDIEKNAKRKNVNNCVSPYNLNSVPEVLLQNNKKYKKKKKDILYRYVIAIGYVKQRSVP